MARHKSNRLENELKFEEMDNLQLKEKMEKCFKSYIISLPILTAPVAVTISSFFYNSLFRRYS